MSSGARITEGGEDLRVRLDWAWERRDASGSRLSAHSRQL